MHKKNCHKTAVIHNISLTKALLSKYNSVVRKRNVKCMALRIYCRDTNGSWRPSNLDPLLQIRSSGVKGRGVYYTVSKTFASSMMYQSLANVTRFIALLY